MSFYNGFNTVWPYGNIDKGGWINLTIIHMIDKRGGQLVKSVGHINFKRQRNPKEEEKYGPLVMPTWPNSVAESFSECVVFFSGAFFCHVIFICICFFFITCLTYLWKMIFQKNYIYKVASYLKRLFKKKSQKVVTNGLSIERKISN